MGLSVQELKCILRSSTVTVAVFGVRLAAEALVADALSVPVDLIEELVLAPFEPRPAEAPLDLEVFPDPLAHAQSSLVRQTKRHTNRHHQQATNRLAPQEEYRSRRTTEEKHTDQSLPPITTGDAPSTYNISHFFAFVYDFTYNHTASFIVMRHVSFSIRPS